jgi:hypothetical protein
VDCSINMVSPVPENKTPYNVLEENDLNISWSEANFHKIPSEDGLHGACFW